MKLSVVTAVAAGALLVVACGGIALAAESGTVAAPVATTIAMAELEAVDEEPGEDVEPTDVEESGLTCVLVPEVPIEGILEPGAVECTGTGNERSAGVALVPRFLAHADDVAGAGRGPIISAWAKTHANQKSDEDDGGDSAVEGGAAASGDDAATEEPPAPATSPGRSGDAPGHGSSSPGNGRGR